jgi:hypothetical protein
MARKMSGQIFISYRREDSSAWAGRLSDRLKNNLPSNKIFMDVDTIDPGVDFIEAIEEVVAACDVLIAVIGTRWLTSSDRRGTRRLDIPEDLVRLEIATALKRGIRVVPVLVEGATMPEAGELPDDLKALVRRNALQIGHIRFDADAEHLVNAVERALEKAREKREREENDRLEADRRQQEEQGRLRTEPLSPPPSSLAPDAPSTPPAQPEATEPSVEIPKVIYPLPPKPVEPEPVEPIVPSSDGAKGKSPSKQVIAILAIAAVLVIGGLIYFAIRPPQSPPSQPAPVAVAIPSPTIIATPTAPDGRALVTSGRALIAAPSVAEKTPTTPEVAVQPSAKPTTPASRGTLLIH